MVLCFTFFFFTEVGCPLQLAGVASELQAALLAFAAVKPEDGAVVLDVHHAGSCGELCAAERTFTWFRHSWSLTC